ncbi:hypothetical protein HELRODRAFT_75379, partial [Helobdella robusta]|uniref:Ras-GEF domain-containing protein n=1 Tax=Helobdella robusta TaxID=6412 RepID=T1G243_HELRO
EVADVNRRCRKSSVLNRIATFRVLAILRQWISRQSQDFVSDRELRWNVRDLLEEILQNNTLPSNERKLAQSIMAVVVGEEPEWSRDHSMHLEAILRLPESPSEENFDSLRAVDIAEQMTYLDHQLFLAIRSEELLGQAWMKADKAARSPHVLLVSKRFNEASRLVVCEIVSRTSVQDRISCIEKWAAIADICRLVQQCRYQCLNNFNGVLQICAAFVTSSVYRLRKTWEKLPKQTRQTIERLQFLVSSDQKFKNMREALHTSVPPCIPFLGMYLTDLTFIEESTANFTDTGLINFSKMRMIARVIEEVQYFQGTHYKIEHRPRVSLYLLDPSRLMEDDQTFNCSLEIEPRTTRSSVTSQVT